MYPLKDLLILLLSIFSTILSSYFYTGVPLGDLLILLLSIFSTILSSYFYTGVLLGFFYLSSYFLNSLLFSLLSFI